MPVSRCPHVAAGSSVELGPPRGLRAHAISNDLDLVLLEWETALPGVAEAGRRLTAAELEITALLQCGLSNAEIARQRDRSPRTVANQLASIFRKCRVSSRLELLAFLLGRHHAEPARSDRRR